MYSRKSITHPAKMSLHLCREIIKRYSKPGDLILDVMGGIGTTIVEGMLLGRNCIGIEYEQKFVDMAKENIKLTERKMGFMKSLGKGMVIKGDSRELTSVLNQVPDNIIFSPPFADIVPFQDQEWIKKHAPRKHIAELYSENKEDKKQIGNLKDKNYLEEMLIIYKNCFLVLKNQGFMVLVLKNFVRKGVQIRLDLDTIKLVEKAGFKYIRRHYRKISNPSFWITNAIQKWEKKHPDKPHPYPLVEDVLVFQKLTGGGAIDTIAFSPPFADQLSKGTDPAKFGNKGNWKAEEKYSTDPENIGNLKY